MNRKERIETIQENLAENDRLYRDGKRSKKLWATCKRDGKHRLTELRSYKETMKAIPPEF